MEDLIRAVTKPSGLWEIQLFSDFRNNQNVQSGKLSK